MSAILIEDFVLFLAQDDMPRTGRCQPRIELEAPPNSDEERGEKS
jgi:hypothetical protein